MIAETKTPVQVLIVDDNPVDREIYQRFLMAHPQYACSFLETELGMQGLALCRTAHPDCVLLDYQLPDLDGLEFLAQLADEQGVTSIPVIMLTGRGSEIVVAEAMRSGAADYIPKEAVSRESLERALVNVIEKYRLRAAVEEQRRQLEQTNADLLHKNKEIHSFYHMLSHELKTPLTVVREFVAIVLDGLVGPLNETQREYLHLAKESCDQMALGFNDLLDATRIDTGKLRVTPHRTGIADVVQQSVIAMTPQAQDEGIRLQHDIDPDLPEVLIDEKRIAQVLANLLSNALKFTPAGGEVLVRVSNDPHRPAYVLVSVHDTGRGIEPEQLSYIFDRLYQVRSDDTAIAGGLGLGLHICHEVVRLHGGEIWVESTPGKGSTFFFTVPKYETCSTSVTREREEIAL